MWVGRVIVFLLSGIAIIAVWQAGVLRERLGWSSDIGNIVWWILGAPVFLGLIVAQGLLYRKIVSVNPFQDIVVCVTMTVQAVIALVIIFYYGIKNSR